MSVELIVAAVIFLATYALIAIRKIGKYEISMPLAALAGGLLMVVFLIVTPEEAFNALNFDTLFLLLGMMLLVASLDRCGFFEMMADVLMSRNISGRRFLITVMILSAVLSAIMLNDAVVLLFTPIVIRCCKKASVNPIPHLVGVFVSANIGSVATAIGNPQNAFIVTKAGISFLDFSVRLIPTAVICMAISCILLILFYRRELEFEIKPMPKTAAVDSRRLKIVIAITIVAIVCFSLSGFFGWKLAYIAMAAGGLAFIVVVTKGKTAAIKTAKSVNWGILVFFAGLFVLVAGIVASGLLDEIRNVFPGFSDGNIPSVWELTVFGAVLSNLVSNVPAAMLIGEMIPIGNTALWTVLAASTTLAGNMTLIGAAANIIVVEEAEKENVKIKFLDFLKIGIPLSVITLVIMAVLLG